MISLERILVLISGSDPENVLPCAGSALEKALHKDRISFGFLLRRVPDEEEQEQLHQLGSARFLVSEGTPFQHVSALWQGEDHVLTVSSAVLFRSGWDDRLFNMLHALEREVSGKPFLTGLPPMESGAVDAFRPLAVRDVTPDQRPVFMPGTPLRLAREPQRTAFLCKDFCFGPVRLFRALEKEKGLLSAAAYGLGWIAYVPCDTVAGSRSDLTPDSPACSTEDPYLETFAERIGLFSAVRPLSGQLRTGIMNPDLIWNTHVPLLRTLRSKWRSLPAGSSSRSMLRVSSFLGLTEHPENSMDENAVFLRRAAILKNIPLFLFADRETMPSVQLRHPNVMEYLDSYGLPMFRPLMDGEDRNLLALSHMFMLQKARERNPGHSHYAWTDPAAVYYPADPETVPDLKRYCTDRIVMGTLNGVPDPSVIIVPEKLIPYLCGEIAALCETECKKLIPLPTEHELWHKLILAHTPRFDLIPITEKYGLMARMLEVGPSDS